MRTATRIQDQTAHRTNSEETTRRHAKTSEQNPSPPAADNAGNFAEYFALAAQATNDALRVWDVASGTLAWPQGLESLLGYQTSIITSEIAFWDRHLHPEDRTRAATSIRDALAPRGAERWSGEYRFRKADGSYLLLLERALIVRDDHGTAVRWIGSLMDITARKELQDQLCRSQRMEAFGQLAGGVAHDFNNFITTILGYTDLLLGDGSIKANTATHLGEIRTAAGRASALAAHLLAFSRKHPLETSVLEVNTLINHLERSFLGLLGENVSVQCELHRAKEGAHIRADRGEITQIILNLVVNARDAMPHGGRLCLTTDTIRIDGSAALGAPDRLPPGEYVSISVADNGVGMTPEIRARLFEPFFTTKDETSRSGLGLATSYGIVRQHGGEIGVESEPGRGTTVTLYLPRVPAPPRPAYKKPSAKKLPSGSETIVVIEDDVSVRHLSVRVLRSLGYNVIEAASGDDAQRLFALNGHGAVDLVVTDVVMPAMSGHHFAAWLRKIRPKAKVVFISGYLDESVNHAAACGEEMYFLPKPFDSTQLALKVREALDAR